MPHKILVAIDGSDKSWNALDLACEVSAGLDADLTIFHVHLHGRPVEELSRMAEVEHLVTTVAGAALPHMARLPGTVDELLSAAGDQVQRLAMVTRIGDLLVDQARQRALDAGARNVTTRTGAGDYADAILQVAEETGSDMIFVGSRGLGLLRGLLLGGVSYKVAQNANCTVVTVR